MKKIIGFVLFMVMLQSAHAQVKIFGDSTLIYSGRAGAVGNELRLKNASRDVFHGLLTNIDGNGLSKWVRPYMIDSFTLVIGDTFHLAHGTSGSSLDSITINPGTNISIAEAHTQAIGSHPVFTITGTATSWRSPLSASFKVAGPVPLSSTTFFQTSGRASGFITDETTNQFVITETCTANNLFAVTSGTQPLSGSMVITFRKNATDQVLTLTIPAGATSGTFSDITHTVSLTAGNLIDYKVVNNATSAGVTLVSIGSSLTGTF